MGSVSLVLPSKKLASLRRCRNDWIDLTTPSHIYHHQVYKIANYFRLDTSSSKGGWKANRKLQLFVPPDPATMTTRARLLAGPSPKIDTAKHLEGIYSPLTAKEIPRAVLRSKHAFHSANRWTMRHVQNKTGHACRGEPFSDDQISNWSKKLIWAIVMSSSRSAIPSQTR